MYIFFKLHSYPHFQIFDYGEQRRDETDKGFVLFELGFGVGLGVLQRRKKKKEKPSFLDLGMNPPPCGSTLA